MRFRFALLTATALLSSLACAADAPAPSRVLVEIYRIAPGAHEQFLRTIAQADEANRLAGLPPRQLYVHQDGANWDFMLIQPASTPPAKSDALDAAWKKLGLPSGARFFVEFRKNIAKTCAPRSTEIGASPSAVPSFTDLRFIRYVLPFSST
jgi:hypothetical protein